MITFLNVEEGGTRVGVTQTAVGGRPNWQLLAMKMEGAMRPARQEASRSQKG